MLDLELLVDATLGVGLATVAGERQLAALDLQAEVAGVDPGELGVDDRARRIVRVEDVDRRGEAGAPRRQADAAEDISEQLVHLAPHALEVGEQVALAGQGQEIYPPARVSSHTRFKLCR